MKKKLNIFLVDNSEASARLYQEVFGEEDICEVFNICYDGQEALDYISYIAARDYLAIPNLIIMEMDLPKHAGLDIINVLKQEERWKRIPILIVSANIKTETITAAYKNFVTGYIQKPASEKDFRDVIKSICDFWHKIAVLPV